MRHAQDIFDSNIEKEFLLSILTSIKQLERKNKNLIDEKSKWENRILLARDAKRSDLESEAEIKLKDVIVQIESINAEKNALKDELIKAKVQLKNAKMDPDLTVNPEALLNQIETMVGESPDNLKDEFDNVQADSALKDLKKQMGLD